MVIRVGGMVFVGIFFALHGGVHGIGLHLNILLNLIFPLILKVSSFGL